MPGESSGRGHKEGGRGWHVGVTCSRSNFRFAEQAREGTSSPVVRYELHVKRGNLSKQNNFCRFGNRIYE